MMQFIPFPLIASLPITERLPVFNKWYPDGIRMPPTWLQSRSGEQLGRHYKLWVNGGGMPVASQFCICKSVNVMSVLCGLNTSIAFLRGPSWTWTTAQLNRGWEREAALGGCSTACLPPLLPPALRSPQLSRTQEVPAIGQLHNRTGRPGFMSWLLEGGGVLSLCLFLGQPSRQFLWPSPRLPASLTLSSVCLPHFCSPFHQLQMWHTAVLQKSWTVSSARLNSQHLLQPAAGRGRQGDGFRESVPVPQLSLYSGLGRQLFYTNCIKIAAIKMRLKSL